MVYDHTQNMEKMHTIPVLRKRGVIFTLDAIFAVLTAMAFFIAILYFLNETADIPYSRQLLAEFSQDSLTILEKNSTLKLALVTDSTQQISEFLNSTPSQFCAWIELRSSSGDALLNATKTACVNSSQPVIERRSFVIGNESAYYARMESWYR